MLEPQRARARASWATLAAIKWFMSARPVHVVKNTHQRLGLACIAAPKFKVWHCSRGASFKNWHKISRALHTFTPCLAKLVWRVLWRAPHFFIPSGKCAVENSSKSVENVPLVWNLKHWIHRVPGVIKKIGGVLVIISLKLLEFTP